MLCVEYFINIPGKIVVKKYQNTLWGCSPIDITSYKPLNIVGLPYKQIGIGLHWGSTI